MMMPIDVLGIPTFVFDFKNIDPNFVLRNDNCKDIISH